MAAAQPAASLEDNIAAYNEMRKAIEEKRFGKWVVFHDRQLVGFYPTYADAANAAMEMYDDAPYLIRQVRNYPDHLPISALIGGGRVAHG